VNTIAHIGIHIRSLVTDLSARKIEGEALVHKVTSSIVVLASEVAASVLVAALQGRLVFTRKEIANTEGHSIFSAANKFEGQAFL